MISAGDLELLIVDAVCASLADSELFGHPKGAFTGADHARQGLIRAAGQGTIFLDEIGDLPLDMQTKLLRLLQKREGPPVGSEQVYSVNADSTGFH